MSVYRCYSLDALGGRVRPLVELPRQGLHGEEGPRHPGHGEVLVIDHIHLGLREDNVPGPLKTIHNIKTEERRP